MGRITDVMASSFSSSALDLEKFKEAMKLVAPAAKATGRTRSGLAGWLLQMGVETLTEEDEYSTKIK